MEVNLFVSVHRCKKIVREEHLLEVCGSNDDVVAFCDINVFD